MKLSDVVGHAGLAFYTEVALILFFVVFVAVLWRTWSPSRRAELEAQGRMPLDDAAPLPAATHEGAPATPSQGAPATPSQGATATPSKGAGR
jgi:cbb3-type cytochrome oxidase subunit 3